MQDTTPRKYKYNTEINTFAELGVDIARVDALLGVSVGALVGS